ncbi:MAG: Gldg family protein, partial [Treponema sp.]|nr:Gldg family protein [Treponema sp.]
AGNENFSYEFYDMNKEENQRLASSLGIQQLQIREIKNNEVGFKNVFMGMAVSYSDQTEILNGLTSSEGMEYRITDAINKVISNTNALLGLSDGVSVTLYKSSSLKDINMIGFDDLESVVKSCVDTLNRKYENRLSFNVVDPSSEEVEKLIERYGVPSYNLESQVATMCIVLENAGRSRVVPFTIQQELSLVDGSEGNQYSQAVFRYAIRGIETLDSSIDESLKALASNVNSVAYVTGHGELALSDEQSGASALSSILSEHYSLKEVNLSESDIPLSVSCVMINGPKTPFTQIELYKLDQFLMNGGNLLMFLDPFDPDPQRDENGMPVYTPLDTGLDKLLEKYGIAVNREYVMDEKCAETENQWTGKAVDLYYAPMLESDSLNQKHAITKNLGYVMFFLPGSIDVSAAEKISGEKVSVLATSSEKSWTESEGMTMEPEYMSPPDAASEKRSNLAVLVEGKFSSAFESAPAKEVKSESSDGEEGDAEKENAEEEKTSEESVYESSTHLLKSVQEGKVLVVSTSFVSGPYLSQSIFQNTGIFVENAVDYMSENEDLCSMRTKGLSLATLDVKSNGFANF